MRVEAKEDHEGQPIQVELKSPMSERRRDVSLREVVVEGTLKLDGTLELDAKPDLSPGRVKVWMSPIPAAEGQPGEGLVEFVERVRRESEARGHRFMTDDEVTAWIEELRSDDDHVAEAYSQTPRNQ